MDTMIITLSVISLAGCIATNLYTQFLLKMHKDFVLDVLKRLSVIDIIDEEDTEEE